MSNKSLGQIAFETYKAQLAHIPIPDWDELGTNIQAAWEAAAQEVRELVRFSLASIQEGE